MKKLLLASTMLLATPAVAQSWSHPNWTDGSVPARSWIEAPTIPTGTLPADTYEPAEASEAGITESQWITTDDGTQDYHQTGTFERKFRITCEHSTNKHIDPILYYNNPGPVGHRHQGNGWVNWTSTSSYTEIRGDPNSTCTGGPLNATNYWEPEMLYVKNGVLVGIRPQAQTFYYINGIMSDPQLLTYLRRNFGFIGGVDPNNYNDTARRAEYSAAGFEYPGSTDTPAGFGGWQCFKNNGTVEVLVTREASKMKTPFYNIPTAQFARHLKAEDGSDPWGGNCTGSDSNHAVIIGNLTAPQCWDASNPRAPDGRGHTAYSSQKPGNTFLNTCPDNHVHLPQLQSKEEFRTTGFNTGSMPYGDMYLSSDRMNPSNTPGDPTSKDPCRQIGPYFCNGSTLHFDWIYGWNSDIADEWQRECLGITVRGVAPTNGPAECNTSKISKFRRLLAGGQASPNTALSGGCAVILNCTNAVPGNIELYNQPPAGQRGNTKIRHKHN